MANDTKIPSQGHSWLNLLKESITLYRAHWRPMTRALVGPLLKITLGAYSCLALSYLFINELSLHHRDFLNQNLSLVLGLLMLVCLLTLSLLCRGFWQYLVAMVSLNLNAKEAIDKKAIDNQPLDCPGAYRRILEEKERPYIALLLAYMLASIIGALPCLFIGPFVVLGKLAAGHSLMSDLLGNAILFLLCLPAALALVVLTPVFQITAFEPVTTNPLPVLQKAFRMVCRNVETFRETCLLQLSLFLLTTFIIPIPVVFLLRLIRLSLPLDALHAWLIGLVLEGAAPETAGWDSVPLYEQMYAEILKNTTQIAASLTDGILGTVILALLLPLGTFAFTLLYLRVYLREPQPEQVITSLAAE